MSEILRRKKDHISLACAEGIRSNVDPGFGKYRFEHNALPEIDFADVDPSVKFLGRRLDLPLMISSITGDSLGEKIARNLAGIANDFGLGMAVGSQRIAFEKESFEDFFRVRRYAPNILLFANFGAVQLNHGYSVDQCRRAVEMIEADALMLHLNPLQEVFQTDGNTNFSNLLKQIEKICSSMDYPLLVKEVGYGISATVAKKLQDVGVHGVEIAGAGTISGSSLESQRSRDVVVRGASNVFADWGNSTVDCLESIVAIRRKMKIIASGGLRTGVDVVKALALGADLCGNASDFLRKIMVSRSECENFVESLKLEIKAAMFCIGCKTVEELKHAKLLKIK